MYLLYSLLLTFGFVLLLPKFVIDALRSGKYVTGLRQRLGNLPRIDSKGRPVIWLHCVSVGEVQAAQSLVRSLSQTFPNFALVISTTTVTGQQIARKIFRDNEVAIFYFPIDWAWTVRRVLRAVNPMAILIMETELWPRLFLEARRRAISLAVLNGRISAASFRRYKLIRPFIARVLNNLTLAVMQSGKDAARIRELGMRDARIAVSGNLKFDSASVSANTNATSEFRNRFDFADGRPLIVAASTHDPEETVVLDAFRRVRQSHPAARLLLAPRHPERFAEVAALLRTSEFSVARRSARTASDDAHADIVLLDSIGELNAVYGLADVAFVGGSIAPSGGHNVIEPAAHGVCTITGPHTQNFSAITNAMLAEDALIQLPNTSEPAAELARVLDELLSNNNRRREIGERAKAVCERNRGATERTIDLISQILAKSGQAAHQVPFSAIHATAAK